MASAIPGIWGFLGFLTFFRLLGIDMPCAAPGQGVPADSHPPACLAAWHYQLIGTCQQQPCLFVKAEQLPSVQLQ